MSTKNSIFTLLTVSLFSAMPGAASADGGPEAGSKVVVTREGVARPVYPEACILKLVAKKMKVTLRDDVPVPPVRYGSVTPLVEFQDAIEPQWGMRPDFVLNSYIFALNRVYIMDDAAYYKKMGRFVDDSIFHELVHFIQVKYQNATFEDGNGDYLESGAVDGQTWFRETYMLTGTPAEEACRP